MEAEKEKETLDVASEKERLAEKFSELTIAKPMKKPKLNYYRCMLMIYLRKACPILPYEVMNLIPERVFENMRDLNVRRQSPVYRGNSVGARKRKSKRLELYTSMVALSEKLLRKMDGKIPIDEYIDLVKIAERRMAIEYEDITEGIEFERELFLAREAENKKLREKKKMLEQRRCCVDA